MGEGITPCKVQHVWTKLPVIFALKISWSSPQEGISEYHYHSCCIYCKTTGTLKYHFSIMQKLAFLWSNLLNNICHHFKGSVADIVEVREFNIFRHSSDDINSNHSVNLVISKVACSYHSNKHKISCFFPRNAYTSLSYSATIFEDMMENNPNTSCISDSALSLHFLNRRENSSEEESFTCFNGNIQLLIGRQSFWSQNFITSDSPANRT